MNLQTRSDTRAADAPGAKARAVEAASTRLAQGLSNLEVNIGALRDRLRPVLSNPAITKSSDTKGDHPMCTTAPLADEITNQAMRVERVDIELRSMLDLLEV